MYFNSIQIKGLVVIFTETEKHLQNVSDKGLLYHILKKHTTQSFFQCINRFVQ